VPSADWAPTAEQAAEILLVRAAEEAQPAAVAPEARIDALEAAGDLDDERAWFARRAEFLLDDELAAWRPLLRVRNAFTPRPFWNLALPALFGLSSNALGPHDRIHVLYNPLVLLMAWNLLSYAALAALGRRDWRHGRPAADAGGVKAARRDRRVARGAPPSDDGALGSGGFLVRALRRSAARFWLRSLRGTAAAREQASAWVAVGTRFLELWEGAARPWFALRTRRVLHLGALGLALGAIAGMYVRGLFFEYEMVWRSTFVRDPETVARVLGVLLAPAAALLGRPAPGVSDAAALLAESGAPAAPWIHLLAATAGLVIVLPRALLAWSAARRLRRVGPALALGLEAPYFGAILAQAREIQVGRVKQEIGDAVKHECTRFADDLAAFVAVGLFDRRIVPLLERFRAEGGRVDALEAAIREASADFEPELAAHVKSAERAFEEGLARDVLERVRPDLVLPPASSGRLAPAARELPARSVQEVGADVSGKLARDLGAAVTLAAGAVAGTLSGGFGAHLGTAILVALLHTTGPVGFLIGALAGVLAAAGVLVAGRARVNDAVRTTSLPGTVVRLVLRPARFDRLLAQGRERCAASVRELVSAKLAPLTDELADQVWARVKPLLARATQGGWPSPTEPS
jgi:hypothetical protein